MKTIEWVLRVSVAGEFFGHGVFGLASETDFHPAGDRLGFLTALARPLAGQPIWDFVERWANWGAPLSLYLLYSQEEATKKTS